MPLVYPEPDVRSLPARSSEGTGGGNGPGPGTAYEADRGGGDLAPTGTSYLVCLGDSHLEPLILAGSQFCRTVARIVVVPGATASGLVNPNSATQARPIFQQELAGVAAGTPVLLCLGEIDAGFLVFLRSQASGRPVSEHVDDALRRYWGFAREEVLSRGCKLLMVSATMPTVEDYGTWGGLGNARREVRASRPERAAMVRYWNRQCAHWCRGAGARWLDLTPYTVDADDRVLPEFLNDDPNDHHLHRQRHGELLLRLLGQEGFS